MELDHVYLIGLVEDQLPSSTAKENGEHSREMQGNEELFCRPHSHTGSANVDRLKNVFGWSKNASRFLEGMGLVT